MYQRRIHCFCTICCLLFSSVPVVNHQAAGQSSTASSTQTIPSPTSTTTGEAVAAQTCPAQASARAADMPSITMGNHATVVYLAQQGNDSSTLQRYDTTSGESQTILRHT